ncbi:MAG: alkaline phosphatase family protein, partial [Candidatus Omnitrophica bacterium]|nr:alkaline phosphatase family protein [Candidatus Omnitrophota bacterium]
MKKRIIIIGLDGVPYGLLNDLSNRGVMPNVKRLIDKGVFTKMFSSIPEISSVAWSSVITGKNPAEHGIFGFTDFPPNTYRLSFPNFSQLKCPAFWETAKKEDRHIVMNVPSTYPARQLNGVLISGFVALDFNRSVYPFEMVKPLEDMSYKIDVESEKAHESFELFLKDLDKTLEARVRALRYLWGQEWKVFMLVFTGTDRLMHFLWDAYQDREHKHHNDFTDHFRKVDKAIGEIISKMGDEDVCVMLSDHGFEKLDYDVYINHLLKEKGFLKLALQAMITYNSIDFGTKAFALDPARIYINSEGKYPRGSVKKEERPGLLKELETLFSGLAVEGRKVIRHIFRKEEVFSGPYYEQAPDLVLIGDKGFNLKGTIQAKQLYSKGIFSGKHTYDDAFLLVSSKSYKESIPNQPKVSDIVGILKKINGG